jgi:acetyl-CoA acyltransferase
MGGTVVWENPHHADYSGHAAAPSAATTTEN